MNTRTTTTHVVAFELFEGLPEGCISVVPPEIPPEVPGHFTMVGTKFTPLLKSQTFPGSKRYLTRNYSIFTGYSYPLEITYSPRHGEGT